MNNVVTVPEGEDAFIASSGSVVIVRHQEWSVTNIEKATDGWTAIPAEGSWTGRPGVGSTSDIHAHGSQPARGRDERLRIELGQCANV